LGIEIDIVIPMYNAAGQINECLDHVFASDYQNFRVTVVDDHSSDDSLNRLARYPSVKIITHKQNRGVSAARNRGVAGTSADILVFIDSDVLIPKNLLGRVADFFVSQPDVALLQARYEDRSYYQNIFSQYKHFVFSFRGAYPNPPDEQFANYIHAACMAVRRHVFCDVIFNEALSRGEDVDFGQRCVQAGHNIFADTTLTVAHKKRYTFFSYTHYQFRTAQDMVLERLLNKSDTATAPYYAKKNPLYKKLWLMRPLLGFFLMCTLFVAALGWMHIALFLLASLVTASFALEVRFRIYLLKFAPVWMSLAAWPLYFYDGIITGLGVAHAVLTFRRLK